MSESVKKGGYATYTFMCGASQTVTYSAEFQILRLKKKFIHMYSN